MSPRKRKKAPSATPPPLQITEQSLFHWSTAPTARSTPPTDRNRAPGDADAASDEAAPGPAPSAGSVPSPPARPAAETAETADKPLPAERGPLSRMMDFNFLEFASYTICSRAIPAVEDGLKPVQRRILHALHEKDDGRFIKVANIVGHTMQYHPHGDASIGDALVHLVNKQYLIEGQGNFGNLFTGDSAAAPRYIECRLTPLARAEVFNPKTTDTQPSYDGRNREPVLLPSKLPLLLMLGAEGIAVGLSTNILPHNFIELLEAQIAIIRKQPFTVRPDFTAGGLMDLSEYCDGSGRLKLRARIKPRQHNRLVITEIPHGTNTETLIASIEDAIRDRKVPVRAINDFTAEKIEIELLLSPGADPDRAIKALFAFTKCETSITARTVVLQRHRPREMTTSEILHFNTAQLLELLRRELEIRRDELLESIHQKTLVRIFVEERIYKRIEPCKTYDAVQAAVQTGFEPFRDQLLRDLTPEDVEMLLGVRIRRISLFDMDKNQRDIEGHRQELAGVEADLKALKAFAIRYLKRLIRQYRAHFPRRTEPAVFTAVEVRRLTAEELSIRWDRETGYLGHGIKTGDPCLECSSLDKLILVWDNGLYRVIPPPEKLFVDQNLLYGAVMDRDRSMTLVYCDAEHGFSYLKRFTFGGAIQNKEYRCTPPEARILLLCEGTPETLYVKYKPARNQRIHQQIFHPGSVAVRTVGARGNQLTVKTIARIGTEKPRGWDSQTSAPPGVLG